MLWLTDFHGCQWQPTLVSYFVIIVITVAVSGPGCSRPGPFVKIHRLFVGKGWTDTVDGVVPPSKKIEQIQQLGQQMRAASPPQRAALAQQLLAMYQAEEDPNIRFAIFQAFGDDPSPQAQALVELALTDSDPDLRVAACRRLGQWGGVDAAERLARTLSTEKSPTVRIAAIRALGSTRHSHALAALGAVLEERDPAFQLEAMIALRRLTGQDFGLNAERWREYLRSHWAGDEEAVARREVPNSSR